MNQISRVKIFIDFWNFELSCKEFGSEVRPYKIDWRKLPQLLCDQLRQQLSVPCSPVNLAYEGAYVYVSYGPRDEKLRRWSENVLSTFPGYTVMSSERSPRSNQKCQQCRQSISNCPSCQAALQGTVEKGVDTKMAVDMIALAWDNIYDVALLVSSDRDFIPVVEMLGRRGKKILQVGISPRGQELASACWDEIDLSFMSDELRREMASD